MDSQLLIAPAPESELFSLFPRRGSTCQPRVAPQALLWGVWTFFEKCSVRRPLLPLESPERASESSSGQARGRSPSRRPGSTFQPNFSSPPESPKDGRFGGRGRVRGAVGCRFSSLAFRYSLNFPRHEARFTRVGTVLPPYPGPLPRHRKRVGGEGTNGGIGTQGARCGSCRWGALGYRLTPRWGSIRKKRPPAASQIPIFRGLRLRRNPGRSRGARIHFLYFSFAVFMICTKAFRSWSSSCLALAFTSSKVLSSRWAASTFPCLR
jgi:hypothetical protein